jgi:hypothetical protein
MISYIFTKSASIVPDAKTRHFLRHRLLLLNSFYDFREEKRRQNTLYWTTTSIPQFSFFTTIKTVLLNRPSMWLKIGFIWLYIRTRSGLW